MKGTIRCLNVLLSVSLCVLFLTAFEKPAYGYVDPGSGILLVQVLSSALGGIVFFLRKRLGRYLQFTRKTLAVESAERHGGLKP